MISYSIYVVDDEETVREGASLAFGRDYRVSVYPAAEQAVEAMKTAPPDLVLLDIGLPGMSGIEALKHIKRLCPDTLVIMITAFEDILTVVSAMKLGAYDYVVKPFQMESLDAAIKNALNSVGLRKEVQALQESCLKENLPCFVGQSDAIQDVMDFVSQVAMSPDTPVLIMGETGTGKELIAKAIHYKSPVFRGPFITLNCAAIPRDLLESELFGYEKGAFSGAQSSGKRGLLEEAEGGTLFLDEVGDLGSEAQAKLLRFLQDGEYYRVGGVKKLLIRTRVISATNKDLDSMMEKDLFRRDLYHRLAVVRVKVPTLNERRDDILPIAAGFLATFGRKFGKTFSGISPEAESALQEFHWQGNIRELRNVIERAVLLSRGPELTLNDLRLEKTVLKKTGRQDEPPEGFQFSPSGVDLPSLLESLEKYHVQEALKAAHGNASEAARLLNLDYYAFRRLRQKLHLGSGTK